MLPGVAQEPETGMPKPICMSSIQPRPGRMHDMGALDGRRALVTGGGRGLGAAIARVLAAEGAAVTVASRSAEEVAGVAGEIGGRAVVMDVADAGTVDGVMAELGDIDVVVANAGVVWPLQRFIETDVDEWERAVAINLFGAV